MKKKAPAWRYLLTVRDHFQQKARNIETCSWNADEKINFCVEQKKRAIIKIILFFAGKLAGSAEL